MLFSCQSNISDFDREENQRKETENDKNFSEEREIISSDSKITWMKEEEYGERQTPYKRKFELQVKSYLANKELVTVDLEF